MVFEDWIVQCEFVRKRRMEQKSKNAISISIIGGADGPTSIFIAGHSKKQPLKIRIKNSIYRYKRKSREDNSCKSAFSF